MANIEQINMLEFNVEMWNKWRENNPDEEIDLSKTNLSRGNLSHANLKGADLSFTKLRGAIFLFADLRNANLRGAELSFADMSNGDLRGANLSGANLSNADFSHTGLSFAHLTGAVLNNTNLSFANLRGANLSNADLSDANLSNADLSRGGLIRPGFRREDLSDTPLEGDNHIRYADLFFMNANVKPEHYRIDFKSTDLSYAVLRNTNLSHADLSYVDLSNADLDSAICFDTNFTSIDLSTTNGLNTIAHYSSSIVSIDTLFKSKGKIPEIFLRGCGIPETLITFLPSMYEEAIQFYSCFISYSHADKEFAKLLYDRLQGQGIRCWLDEHQLKPGDELHKTIYEGIRVYDKVILCCSETALKSWWVEKEFKNAITKEEDYTETVLIPITLDKYLFEQSKDNWTIGEINRRFVQDFSNWKDHDAFESAFKKVVDALRTDGGKPPPPTPKLTRRK